MRQALSEPRVTNSTMEFGVNSMVAPLLKVAMRKPGYAILHADPIRWHYSKQINSVELQNQYHDFLQLLEQAGTDIVWMDDADDGLADSIFTYDPSFITPAGAIIMNPGKPLREKETDIHLSFYKKSGIPVIDIITAPAKAEGGDCLWLDNTTLAVGRGYRTNQAGIDQLTSIFNRQDISVLDYDLPVYQGSGACLHLMSLVSLLADKLALVYSPLMPVTLYQDMQDMGFTMIDAPQKEFEDSGGMNLNVLSTAPMQCIAVDGFEKTHALMRQAGCTVTTFQGDELCIPCEGGPTCMTRPLLRA